VFRLPPKMCSLTPGWIRLVQTTWLALWKPPDIVTISSWLCECQDMIFWRWRCSSICIISVIYNRYPLVRVTTSPTSESKLFRQCVILDVSQPYRPAWPVLGIAFFAFASGGLHESLVNVIVEWAVTQLHILPSACWNLCLMAVYPDPSLFSQPHQYSFYSSPTLAFSAAWYEQLIALLSK
jgi:hypothetical protein